MNLKSKSRPKDLEEVRDYCIERRNGVDWELWFDHYTANGWKVGRNDMKDWRAAVRTWERRLKPVSAVETMSDEEIQWAIQFNAREKQRGRT